MEADEGQSPLSCLGLGQVLSLQPVLPDAGGGLGARLTPAFPRRGSGGEGVPRKNEGARSGLPSPFPTGDTLFKG